MMTMVRVMTTGKYVLRYIGSIYISGQPMDRKLNDKQCVTRRINQDAYTLCYQYNHYNISQLMLLKLDAGQKKIIDVLAVLLLVVKGEKKSGKLRSL